ncbi:MAG: PAS domain-containing protein, partial [Thermoplasmata archaeon]|nr:PAS domain-containing protein [Thermoplasmata archaeon]
MTINVLLVDDEPSFIELTQEYLRNQEDIVIDGFESVASASDALKKKSYDVIISDYQMPGDSGLDFLRTLRKEGNDIPFVLFTGRGREEVVIEALNLGADSYIQKGGKPTAQFAELSNIIRNLYQQRKAKLDLAYLQVQISTIFESLPGYAFIKDKNGAYVAANRQFLNLTGKTLDELIGKTPYEIFPKEIASKFQTEDDAVLTSGCPLFTEAVFEIDGKKMPVAIRKVPLGDNSNNIVGLIGLAFDISELKDTERALREESQLLNDVFASIQDGLCVLNKDLTVLRENPAMARIYPPFNPPVVGKKCYYAYNNKESRCPDCHAWRAIEKGEVIREHVHRFDPDNAEHWTEIFHFPYYELDSNKIKGVILYLRDITEKKLADKALQEGDRFISLLFSSIQDGISVLDRDLNIVQVNPAMEKWYAHMSPLVGKKCYEAFQGRTEPCKICPSKRCLESGKPQHGIVSMPENAKTGVEYFDLFSFPIKNPETLEIEGVIEYVRDATDRENALNALKREHQQLLAIFESIDESIYVVDPETHEILYVNHAVIEDFGNVIGKKCYKVFQDLDTPCPFCTNDKIFGENIGQPYIWEFENLVLRRWYHCIDRAIIWPDGRLVRCEIAIDVTDRMLSEEQLNQAMKRLDILNKMTRHDM